MVGMITVVEERHDRVSGLVAAWDGGDRGGAGQRAFFEREVGVDVDLCGGNTFVAEPEGDLESAARHGRKGLLPRRYLAGESLGDYCGSDAPSSTARSRTA